jgi:GTPase SAR1 family protein
MFNYEKNGKKIAVHNRTINGNKRQRKIYLSEDEGYEKIEIKEGEFMASLDKEEDRAVIYVAGASGSGKSYWVAQYCEEFHKNYKNYPIYLISENNEDPAFDNKSYIKRLMIEDMATNPIDYKEFENCLVIFDDVDSIKGALGKEVDSLRDKLLKNSRKFKVSVITTNHDACGIKLKSVLNESRQIVFFLLNYNRSLKYLCENYLGLNKNVVEQLRKNNSRWTCFVKNYPSYIIQQKMITSINYLEKQ